MSPKMHANSTYIIKQVILRTNGQDSDRRTRNRHVPAARNTSRACATGRCRSWTGLRPLDRSSVGGLLLFTPAAPDGGSAGGRHQRAEGFARELLLLASRCTVPPADRPRRTHQSAQERAPQE